MSITAKIDLLAQEIFGEFYDALTKYEQQLIMTIYELDEVKDFTDLSILKQDNIYETKKINRYES